MTATIVPTPSSPPRADGEQLNLFRQLTILEWLPDETLYSLVARLHHLSGFRRESTTSNLLFGHPRAGLRHDFQHSISEFEQRTGSSLGSAEQILLRHTILPLFLCFNDREFSRRFVRSLSGGYWDAPTPSRPFITVSTRGCQPLKACPECMARDQERFGVSYWHRSHQFPGVWVCAPHNCPLLSLPVSNSQSTKYSLRLPRLCDLKHSIEANDFTATAKCRHALLVALRDSILEAANNYLALQIAPTRVIDLFKIGAQEKGLCSENGRLHVRRMGESFEAFVAPIAESPDFLALLGDSKTMVTELARMLRGTSRRFHPVRYILIAIWLFGSWTACMKRLLNKSEQLPAASNNERDKS